VSSGTARWLGGLGALLIGAVYLDLNPPIGVIELIAAIAVLATRRPRVCLAATVPTFLVFGTALLIMVDVSGPNNPVMWSMAVASGLTMVALVRGSWGIPVAAK
jgi:hypothetical protein